MKKIATFLVQSKLDLRTEKECDLIVKNILAACQDMNKLNHTGYDFIYLCPGFLAHSSFYGFIAFYDVEGKNPFKEDVIQNWPKNRWNNFHKGEKDYLYYWQKEYIYGKIIEGLTHTSQTVKFNWNMVN